MRSVIVACVSALLLIVACNGLVRADIPPEDSRQCGSLAVGAACTRDNGTAGHCEDATCSRARATSDYACRLCVAGAPPAPAEPAKKPGCGTADVASDIALLGGALVIARARVRSRKRSR